MKVYLVLFALLLAAGCKKDDSEAGLPEATHEGKNTAGCLINGERFVATGYGSGLSRIPSMSGGYSFDSLYYIEFSGTLGGRNTDLSLFLRNVRRPPRTGVYVLNQNTQHYPQGVASTVLNHATITVYNNGTSESYGTNIQNTGQVELAFLDYSHGISAGTFGFTAANILDRNKTITITSGRFDRKQ